MNDTLKVAGRIGAELGAAKAENDRLRGLLHGAHDTIRNLAEDLDEEEFQVTIDQLAEIELALAPQQAEPEEVDYSYHSHEFAKAQTEPAPAQDEQPVAWRDEAGTLYPSRESVAKYLPEGRVATPLYADPIAHTSTQGKFRMGDLVKKSTGSEWVGRVVGWYSTEQTKEGYAVESSAHRNSVQIYPVTALEAVE